MRTSGLVLDLYDDVGGQVLKTMFSSREAVPDFVKQAHAIAPEEHTKLPDDSFALVLVNGDEKLRKFACIDAGNTSLSVLYFLKHAHKLPEEARAVAAENLKTACSWYDLDVPEELEKEAGLGSMALRGIAKNPGTAVATALTAPSLVRGTSQNIKANLAKVRAGEAAGGAAGALGAMAGHGMEHLAEAFKTAEVVGTTTMPLSAPVPSSPPKAVIKKTAHLRPVVDVTDKEAMSPTVVKKASRFALEGRYPLDSYDQVKTASAYFGEYGKMLSPDERREYCSNLVQRADELDIPLSDTVRTYGSEKYASASALDFAIDARLALIPGEDNRQLLQQIKEAAAIVPPEDYAILLSEFDKLSGLHLYYDADVPDPFLSTYGFEKDAESVENFRDTIGNWHVTGADLLKLRSNVQGLKSTFGDEICDEYVKDPIGIYKSLPVDQKKLIIRMATENSPI